MALALMHADSFEVGAHMAEVLCEASALTGIGDPYDRMVVVQARVPGVPLITGTRRSTNLD